jgi:hypothetical protein
MKKLEEFEIKKGKRYYYYFYKNKWREYNGYIGSLPFYVNRKSIITVGIHDTKFESYKEMFQGGLRHRLDGPAIIWINKTEKNISSSWYIHDIFLGNFEEYYTSSGISQKLIFEYVQIYPEYIKEIELLARHNNWLNEKELELLNCADMFR